MALFSSTPKMILQPLTKMPATAKSMAPRLLSTMKEEEPFSAGGQEDSEEEEAISE